MPQFDRGLFVKHCEIAIMNTPPSPTPGLSNPSLSAVSAVESSIRFVAKPSRTQQIVLIALVFVGLAALAITFFLFVDKTEKNKAEAARQEALAKEIKHINVQSITTVDDDDTDPLQDDAFISFNFYTTPSGADVYQDGNYLGTTPIEQKKLPKSAENEDVHLVIVLEGHRIERRTIRLLDNFSDAVELEKIVYQAVQKPADTGDGDMPVVGDGSGVFKNRAVVMDAEDGGNGVVVNKPAQGDKSDKSGKTAGSAKNTKKDNKTVPSGDDDVVLPD